MARQDLGKIISEITEINATVDNGVGVPSATATITGTATEKIVNIDFKNLKGDKGDKPAKGTDYYTEQEKQEFVTETNALVAAEGKKQVKELQNQSSLSIERLLKIQKEIETILQNQEAIGNALALNGKSGPQYDKEIRNIAGGEFDPDLLFLNDAGTKTAGKLYYDKNKSGVFKCIQTTTSTVNSTTNFVDVSSLENANKLENLSSFLGNTLMKLTIDNPISEKKYLSDTFNSNKLSKFMYAIRIIATRTSFTHIINNYANKDYVAYFNYGNNQFSGIRLYTDGYMFYGDSSGIKEMTIYDIKIK